MTAACTAPAVEGVEGALRAEVGWLIEVRYAT
jgi:hypothetical protein